MSDSNHDSDSPLSQFSIEDDEIVWTHDSSLTDTDFIVLRHPLLDTRSLPSTLSDFTGHLDSDGELPSVADRLSPCFYDPSDDRSSTNAESANGSVLYDIVEHSSSTTSAGSGYYSGASTPTASYDDASVFITRFLSSPVKEKDAELGLLRALIIELGLRSPNCSDLPFTLTSARKMLKAEAHVNVKEYAATRHKGQQALREILKPSKSALRKEIRKGNGASLRWIKEQGLQVLLVTCFK